jgi:hypothetical protein
MHFAPILLHKRVGDNIVIKTTTLRKEPYKRRCPFGGHLLGLADIQEGRDFHKMRTSFYPS